MAWNNNLGIPFYGPYYSLSPGDLTEMAARLGIVHPKRTANIIKEEIVNLDEI